MSTVTKVVIAISVVGVAGLGIYLYLRKKAATNANIIPSPGLSSGLTTSQQTGTTLPGINTSNVAPSTAPTTSNIATKATNPPVPWPSDLTAEETNAIKNFCSLPIGSKKKNGLIPNYGLDSQWGIVNRLYFKSKKQLLATDEEFKAFKSYMNCL